MFFIIPLASNVFVFVKEQGKNYILIYLSTPGKEGKPHFSVYTLELDLYSKFHNISVHTCVNCELWGKY